MTDGAASARCIRVRGQVQGVGFRPFIWRLARERDLDGEVMNDAEGVLIRARGADLDGFEAAIREEAPPLARIDAIESTIDKGEIHPGFHIVASGKTGAETRVTFDAATCDACLAEIVDPAERRYGYAFANCTHCGPRFTILREVPYDRAKTTMAPFKLCKDCEAEYEDPEDRRFHAQPIACPVCGPRLWFEDAQGVEMSGDPIALAVEHLREGQILAIKGLGGFHLACDARNAAAVEELRHRKRRPSKPFALMAPLEDMPSLVDADEDAMKLLRDPAAPIVLAPWRDRSLPGGIAPGMTQLGVMAPYTPLHHLLFDALGRNCPLVMTSGNLSGEPQAIDNAEAREKLAPFVDGFLIHNRDIARRLDDGVETNGPLGPMTLRRARGRVPGVLPLPEGLPDRQVVAYGGQLKSAICLTKNGQAMLSHHLGDLDDMLTVEEFLKADADLAELFDHRPEAIAVDLHPDFRSSRHGAARAEALRAPLLQVQHHHAHMAAQLGEARWSGASAVGVVLDGLGLGPDGKVWGGEVLVGDYATATRAAWLETAPLVGGDLAQAEPWRNAVVRLDQAGLGAVAERLFPDQPLDILRRAADAGVNAPHSSSVGRLFDAVAACLHLTPARQSYEGEAAMRLQAIAASPDGAYPFGEEGGVISPKPMFTALAEDLECGVEATVIAGRFHLGLAQAFAAAARCAAEAANADTIALSGGCFQNVLLLSQVAEALSDFRICAPGHAPANDGGLAYGQALVALARMETI